MAKKSLYICKAPEGTLVAFDSERFEEAAPKKAARGFCAAVLPEEALISHTFKIPSTTAEEKIPTLVEITMYEEGGLELEEEYAIAYVRHPLDFESSWLIEAFAVLKKRLQELYGATVAKTGHLDLVTVPYFVYESLYLYDKANPSTTELFVYLGERASFAVLCKEGRYIAHRRLPSLESIALKAQVSVEALREALSQRGLEKEKYGPDEGLLVATIETALSNVVERVAQTVNHKRGIFGIGTVDTVLLDFGQATIPGLWELFDAYGFGESRKGTLACCETLEPAKQHEGVEALCLLAAMEGKCEPPNLTLFERRPPLWASHTGRFVAATAAALLLTGLWGWYSAEELDALASREADLQVRLTTVKEQSKKLREKLMREKEAKAEVAEAIEETRKRIRAYDEAADAMMLIKASKAKRQQMMKDVVETMRKYALSATSMEQNGSRTMAVDLITGYEKRDRIAKFMKDLVDLGYGSVGTKAIRLDERVYQSVVEIER